MWTNTGPWEVTEIDTGWVSCAVGVQGTHSPPLRMPPNSQANASRPPSEMIHSTPTEDDAPIPSTRPGNHRPRGRHRRRHHRRSPVPPRHRPTTAAAAAVPLSPEQGDHDQTTSPSHDPQPSPSPGAEPSALSPGSVSSHLVPPPPSLDLSSPSSPTLHHAISPLPAGVVELSELEPLTDGWEGAFGEGRGIPTEDSDGWGGGLYAVRDGPVERGVEKGLGPGLVVKVGGWCGPVVKIVLVGGVGVGKTACELLPSSAVLSFCS